MVLNNLKKRSDENLVGVRGNQYRARKLDLQTIALLEEKLSLVNEGRSSKLGYGVILKRALELLDGDQIERLKEENMTVEMKFERQFIRWKEKNPGKTMEDFKSHLLDLSSRIV
jgi:hypothetical protein